jgi:hypothetical protein
MILLMAFLFLLLIWLDFHLVDKIENFISIRYDYNIDYGLIFGLILIFEMIVPLQILYSLHLLD